MSPKLSVFASLLNTLSIPIFVTKKSIIQYHFGSKARATLYELLCHHSLTCSDQKLEEFLSYHPTRCPSHVIDHTIHKTSDHESVHSIDSSVSAFYSDDSTYSS